MLIKKKARQNFARDYYSSWKSDMNTTFTGPGFWGDITPNTRRLAGYGRVSRGTVYSARSRALARRGAMRKYPSKYKGYASKNKRTGGFLGIELKFLDENITPTALVSNGDWTGMELDPTGDCIGSMISGSGQSQRDGIKYTIKSIYISGHIEISPDTTYTAQAEQTIMLALVQDKNTNGAQLNSEEVFINESGIGDACPDAIRNMQYTHRFTVHDKVVIQMGSGTIGWNGTTLESRGQRQRFTLKMDRMTPVHCTSSLATVSNIEDNSFHLVGCKSHTGEVVNISYMARTRFYAR